MTFHSTGRHICNKLFGWLARRRSLALRNMSEGSRAKLSALQMGNTRGQGHKVGEKVMNRMVGNKLALGHKHTPEWFEQRAKFRHTPETRAAMSRNRRGNKNGFKN